jgi:hypothetical protein
MEKVVIVKTALVAGFTILAARRLRRNRGYYGFAF